MKIIFGTNRHEQMEHAQRMLRKLRRLEDEHPAHAPRPMGIATHSAHYPQSCDECGVTFWAKDPYSAHRGCKGDGGSPLGFR